MVYNTCCNFHVLLNSHFLSKKNQLYIHVSELRVYHGVIFCLSIVTYYSKNVALNYTHFMLKRRVSTVKNIH